MCVRTAKMRACVCIYMLIKIRENIQDKEDGSSSNPFLVIVLF